MADKRIKDIVNGILDSSSILEDEPMSRHTTFRVGGNASFFVSPKSEDEIVRLVKELNKSDINFEIVGNGSNLLVSDEGYDGVIINIASEYSGYEIAERSERGADEGHSRSEIADDGESLNSTEERNYKILVKAGTMLGRLGNELARAGIAGFEFASGIPGTIGGAIVMNAGAYGGEMKDVVSEVKVCDSDGRIIILSNEELKFGYRDSIIKRENYTVLEVILNLSAGDPLLIQEKLNDLKNRRCEKQPLEYASAGSTFKRPVGNFAGKLIEEANLKGFNIGGAYVSEKHAGFIVNKGEATAADIYQLIEHVIEEVRKNAGVTLEPEVKMLGF